MIDFSNRPIYPKQVIDDHTYSLATVGYSVFRDFLTPAECDYFIDRLAKAIRDYKPRGSDRSFKDQFHLHDLMCTDPSFGKKLEDPRLQQIVEPILGKHWIMYAYTTSSLPPQGKNYGSRIHVDSPRFIPGYQTNVGLLWVLDDFTHDNGGTFLLPGSHHHPDTPDEDYFHRHAIQVTCPKGSLLVFNARVWHCAGENRTSRWRHSLTMNVCRPYMKQRMDWVRFIPATISNSLNAQARRIIGFDTRLPSSLDEFFVDEADRLYKANQE